MTIRITSSAAAVAATPYIFGFTPTDSLVLLFKQPTGTRGSMRVDLPDSPDLRWLGNVLAGVTGAPPEGVILIAYADTVPAQFAERMLDWVMEALSPVTDVIDLVLVNDGAMHSLFNSMETGADEVPLTELENHPIVAELVAEGMAKLPNRQVLEARLEPVHDEVASRVLGLLDTLEPDMGTYEQWRERTEARCLEVLLGDAHLLPRDVMTLGLACADVFVRDPLITILLTAQEQHPDRLVSVRDRLTYCVGRLPDDLAGPTAATLALLAWASGDGAGALVAAERAMTADPTNTLGPLVAEAVGHGLPPHTWSSLTEDIPLEVLRGQYRRTA